MTLEEAQSLLWGTRGKSGQEPVRNIPLGELETDHLVAILHTQKQITAAMIDAILIILKHRWIEEHDRLKIDRRSAIESTKARSQ